MPNSPSDLPGVIKEIVAALLESDWTRYNDDSGERFYYIIRERDHGHEVDSARAFSHIRTFVRTEPDVFEEWYVRAALAEEPPDRLRQARKRVQAAGFDPAVFDALLQAVNDANTPEEFVALIDRWMPHIEGLDRLHALTAVLQALRIERVRKRELFVSEAERPELRGALEARFLRELAERFPKVVKRASSFDWLSFSDPQVREASRCYLYGFFRSAVLVAAAALEARLKDVAAVGDDRPRYEVLVGMAFGKHGVCGSDPARVEALTDVFNVRNRVAHSGGEPTTEEAERVLIAVRDTFDLLAQRLDSLDA
jgi:hypothetical protein